MDVKHILDKLKTPVFWVMLVSIISSEILPMLEPGQNVNIAAIVKIVLVAFTGLVATPPKALSGGKKEGEPPSV